MRNNLLYVAALICGLTHIDLCGWTLIGGVTSLQARPVLWRHGGCGSWLVRVELCGRSSGHLQRNWQARRQQPCNTPALNYAAVITGQARPYGPHAKASKNHNRCDRSSGQK